MAGVGFSKAVQDLLFLWAGSGEAAHCVSAIVCRKKTAKSKFGRHSQ